MPEYYELDVSDAEALSVVDENKEVVVTIVKAIDMEEHEAILLTLSVDDEPMSADFTHFLNLSHKDGTLKQEKACKYHLKMFLETFGISTSEGFSLDDMIGQSGTVIIGVKESDNYGRQNTIKRCVTPKDNN